MHQGPAAEPSRRACCPDVRAIARCFFTRGGSLLVTGLVVTSPHLIARENAVETTPAIFRTVFALIGRGSLVRRTWPPNFSKRPHSRLRCRGVISAMGRLSN